MEAVSILLFLFLFLCAIIDIHNTIIVFAPLSVLCQPYLCLRYESPAISLLFISEFILLLLLIIKRYKKIWKGFQKGFPFKGVIIAIIFTYIIGIVVSPMSFMETAPHALIDVVAYLFIFAFYYELRTAKDLSKSLKSLAVAACILSAYAIFEYVSQSNPFIEHLSDILPIEKGWVYYSGTSMRYGSVRCQSLMCICISWGALCCLLLSVILYFSKTKFEMNGLVSIISGLLLIAMNFVSGTRSSIVFLALIIIGWLISYRKKKQFILIVAVLLVAIIAGEQMIQTVIDSFSANTDVSGSSALQRQVQLATAYSVISSSPIWGLGMKGVLVAQDLDSDVLGAESIWLQQLIEYGFIGIGVQIYIYYQAIRQVCLRCFDDKKVLAVFIVIGWVFFCSMTSSPGLSEAYFFVILTMLIKSKKLVLSGKRIIRVKRIPIRKPYIAKKNE